MPVATDPDCPPRRALRRRACAAFSMVELSVVIAIISIVAVMGLEMTATIMSRTAFQSTTEKLGIIDQAIVNYRRTYGRLPCPALSTNLTTNSCYGKGAYSGDCNAINTCAATLIDVPSTTDDLRHGDVPVRDLNLPLNYMTDGYGQKLSYVVTSKLTMAGPDIDQYAHSASVDAITVRSGKQDVSCGTGGNRCQTRGTAAYFLFSTGSDRRGSLTPAGATTLSCLASPTASYDGKIDTVNCRLGAALSLAYAVPTHAFYDSRYNIGTQEDTYFDDVVKWRSKKDL